MAALQCQTAGKPKRWQVCGGSCTASRCQMDHRSINMSLINKSTESGKNTAASIKRGLRCWGSLSAKLKMIE